MSKPIKGRAVGKPDRRKTSTRRRADKTAAALRTQFHEQPRPFLITTADVQLINRGLCTVGACLGGAHPDTPKINDLLRRLQDHLGTALSQFKQQLEGSR